jgi:streptogramin lyase
MKDGSTRHGTLPPLTPACVSVAHLLPLLDADELTENEAAAVREHVATCARCQSRMAGFAVVDSALRRHYGEPMNSESVIALADVISTAEIEEEPISIERRNNLGIPARRYRLASVSSVFGTVAAVLAITLLAALLLRQMTTRIGSQHPRPTSTAVPSSGVKQSLSITTFDVPTAASHLSTSNDLTGIIAGPDGNLWVANEGFPPYPGSILRITPNGATTEYSLASGHIGVKYIAEGSDGNLWFTEYNDIGRITLHGAITEFPLPGSLTDPSGIAGGPDGNIWFTATATSGNGVIGRVTPQGAITIFPILTPHSTPQGISAGPDGAVWFAEVTPNQDGLIGRISPQGKVTEFAVPTPGSAPTSIITGPDGNLWFTESGSNKIARMTTNGVIKEFPLPTPNSGPTSIIVGPDHNLWFTEPGGQETSLAQIGRISANGDITEYSIPTLARQPIAQITFDSQGRLWFTLPTGQAIVVRVNVIP